MINHYANAPRQPVLIQRTSVRVLALSVLLAASGLEAAAYEARIHQQLTFLAAKHFTRCLAASEEEALTPLEVRYVARANVALAQSGFFRRGVRWSYYPRGDADGRALFGLIETRFGDQFDNAVGALEQAASEPAEDAELLKRLGRVVFYVQEVSSPAHVVPVYTSRWWRFSVGDRFDSHPVDEERVETLLEGACSDPLDDLDLYGVLAQTAERTLGAVDSSIPGMPSTWQAYWRFPKSPGEFGEYGPAGNRFGLKSEFRCEQQRCVLLRDDPLYEDFAAAQHALAVRATAQAMLLVRAPALDLPAPSAAADVAQEETSEETTEEAPEEAAR